VTTAVNLPASMPTMAVGKIATGNRDAQSPRGSIRHVLQQRDQVTGEEQDKRG